MIFKTRDSIISAFQKIGQGHIFEHLENLPQETQQALLNQAHSIDLKLIEELIKGLSSEQNDTVSIKRLTPPPYISLPTTPSQKEFWQKALSKGEEAIRSGRVAAFVVAGGMGTRLNSSGPKGLFEVTPLKKKTLFQVFAEKIKAAQQRYQTIIPWFIMTSQGNHQQTIDFFRTNHDFGLKEVHFFNQGQIPTLDHSGRIVLNNKGLMELVPDGHGGSLNALLKSGAIEKMEALGVDIISYFQVDNPLIQCIDPVFVGFYLLEKSEMASKMVKKITPLEKVGLFCQEGTALKIIEYSDVPESLINRQTSEGNLAFHSGNIAAHIIDRDFIKRLASSQKLPFHTIRKTIDGVERIKFEQFIFDALVLAENPIILEISREKEFSPVKNARGKDSPDSCRQDQLLLYKNWLEKVGINIPSNEHGIPHFTFEISPSFADTETTFLKKWTSLQSKPTIQEGTYLE